MLCNIIPCGMPAKVNPNGRPSAKGMCSRHYTRTLKHGTPWPKVRTYRIRNSKYASYSAMHYRVRKASGRAAEYDCVDCGGEAHEWSYSNSGVEEVEGPSGQGYDCKYSLDVSQYEPRCVPCHRTFDENPFFVRRASGTA